MTRDNSQLSPRYMHPNMQQQSILATLLPLVLLLHWEGVSLLTEISRSPISFALLRKWERERKKGLFCSSAFGFFHKCYCLFLTVLLLFRIMLEKMFCLSFFFFPLILLILNKGFIEFSFKQCAEQHQLDNMFQFFVVLYI